MSEEERIELSKRLEEGLKISFERMLRRKQLLGESIVTSDGNGNPITISADEAWELYRRKQSTESPQADSAEK